MEKKKNNNHYQSSKDAKKRYRKKNKEKINAYYREVNKLYPERALRHKLKALYGLSLETFKVISDFQKGKCKICKKNEKLVVDHNHATGFVRALLCKSCNSGLGFFKDSPEILIVASEYLKTHKPVD